MSKKVYARCVSVIDDGPLIGKYTPGREYEVLLEFDYVFGRAFDFIDDDDIQNMAWWDGDPDSVWERIERDV